MVQAADFRECDDLAFRRSLHASWRRRVFLERQMCPRCMIVGDELGKHSPHVRWAEDDHVIQTLAAQGSNESLRMRILPRAGTGSR
jgi:hypothetical protein